MKIENNFKCVFVMYDTRKFTTKFAIYAYVVQCDCILVLWSNDSILVLLFFVFSLTVKAAPHECVIRTGQP